MERQLFTLVLADSMAIIGFTGCSKNADKPTTDVGGNDKGGGGGSSLKDKLVGTYKMTELALVQGESTTDILEQYNSCDRDNLYILNPKYSLAFYF